MPMIEFVWWPSTVEFLEDFDGIISPTVSHISSARGCLGIYYGLQDVQQDIFWMVVVWESHAHHAAMMDSPEYTQMVGRLKPFLKGELKMNHVEFNKETTSIFEADVTAILFLRPASAAERMPPEKVNQLLENLGKECNAAWGNTQEEPETRVLVGGLTPEGNDFFRGIDLQGYLLVERLQLRLKCAFSPK